MDGLLFHQSLAIIGVIIGDVIMYTNIKDFCVELLEMCFVV